MPPVGYGTRGYGTGGKAPLEIPSIGYYLSLLTSQYQGSVKHLNWLTAVLQIFVDIGAFTSRMVNAFDIDAALGPQLDALGAILGVPRMVPFTPTHGVSPILTDVTYRILLRAKLARNSWDGRIGSLYGIWQGMFPGGLIAVEDNQNMTATIFLAGAFTSITQDLIVNGYIVPRPQAVQYTYVFSALPVFGVDFNNTYVAGPDVGHAA